MRGKKFLEEQRKNRVFENSEISMVSNSTLVIVDIQPEYEAGFTFNIENFCNFLNENVESTYKTFVLYNGEETMGMISENELKFYYLQHGLEEDKLEYLHFYDKGYAFFRSCMDTGIDDEQIANVVKYMIKYNINDSRNFDENHWKNFISIYGDEDVEEIVEYLKDNDDMVYVPELIEDILSLLSGRIVMCGGGLQECLKEVEIGLMALDKPYSLLTKYTY